MSWGPVINPDLIALLAAAVILATTWSLVATIRAGALSVRVGACSFVLRLLVAGSLVVILGGPTTTTTQRSPSDDGATLPILVDRTLSMCVDDVEDQRGTQMRRLDLVDQAWLDPAFLEQLAAVVSPEIRVLDETVTQTSATDARSHSPVARETRLVRAVADIISEHQDHDDDLAGIVILSDGHDTTGRALNTLIGDVGDTPIYAAVLGKTSREPDLSVRLSADHEIVYRGEQTTLRLDVQHFGLDGREVEAVLEENGNEIERRAIVLSKPLTRIAWPVTPQAPDDADGGRDPLSDLSSYTVRVTSLPDERVTENNTRHAFVEVQRERIHVVVFENEPYWDTKYLISALRTDPQVRLTTVTGFGRRVRVAHHRANESDPDAPVVRQDVIQGPLPEPLTRDWLFHYDVVVLGRGVDRWFNPGTVALLRSFVTERGGSLILARGVPFDVSRDVGRQSLRAVESLLPVTIDVDQLLDARGGDLMLTREGGHVPALDFEGFGEGDAIITSMPGMLARTRVLGEKAMSTVWLRGDPEAGRTPGAEEPGTGAAVAHQRIGRGMVMMVLTDGLWRWALMRPEMEIYDPVFRLFWIRAVRWLAGSGELLPGRSVGLALSRLSIGPDEPVEITVQTRFVDPSWFAPTLRVIAPDGQEHAMNLAAEDGFSDRMRTTFTPRSGVDPAGVYTVVLECQDLAPPRLVKRFAVYDPTRELLDTSARVEEMRTLVEASGGMMLPADDPSSLLDLLERKAEASATMNVPKDAWPRWWVLSALVGCLCAEWMMRWWVGRLS